jgi:DNA-binding response OmpR family regulator
MRASLPPATPAVLLVDDDPPLRQAVQWALEDEGLRVEVAADGLEALTRAAHARPALVVLDYGLPNRDGASLAAALRRACGALLPVLLVTGDGHAQQKAAAAGAFAYLHKPFDMDRLVELVRGKLGEQPGE